MLKFTHRRAWGLKLSRYVRRDIDDPRGQAVDRGYDLNAVRDDFRKKPFGRRSDAGS